MKLRKLTAVIEPGADESELRRRLQERKVAIKELGVALCNRGALEGALILDRMENE